MAESYTRKDKEVINAERGHIGSKSGQDLYGLAISGGGIRSASFGLGVLQSLVGKGILEKMHYLSTVSGGGYIGSSLTWFLQKGLPDGQDAGKEPGNFPFGSKESRGGQDPDKRNAILDFIRQHSNYLIPGHGLNTLSVLGVVIRSTFVSLLVYFSMAVFIMMALTCLGVFLMHTEVFTSGPSVFCCGLEAFKSYGSTLLLETNWLIWVASALIITVLIGAIYYSFKTLTPLQYKDVLNAQKRAGLLWGIILGLLALGAIPFIIEDIHQWYSGAGSSIIGLIIGLYEQLKSKTGSKKNVLNSTIRIIIGTALFIYGIFALSFITAQWGLASYGWYAFLPPLTIALAVGLIVNLNVFGYHRMYRDRLMETFMANSQNIIDNAWGPATDADSEGFLKDMCEKHPTPYHIINTNLVTTGSKHVKLHSRGGDNFILSPLYCGGDSTGWQSTAGYRTHRWGNNGIKLATAMAISGAAVNPSAGPNGQGLTKNRLVSMLLGLLNIQLGFWSDNPNPSHKGIKMPTNFIWPGLTSNVLGQGLSEESRSILLTDGGHFENLGLYELIRRKLRVIIVSDGGADPDYKFEDLSNLIEKVRVDFGAQIKFPKYKLGGLLPDEKKGALGNKIATAERGFAIGNIKYGGGSEGLLIYIKTTIIDDLPADIYGYKFNHPSFPDQSTGDQFFDEVQFESYRELGYQLTKDAFSDQFLQQELVNAGF